jgi:hypothetical protein
VFNIERLHDTVMEPNICGSLVWNWLHVTFVEPNICRSLVRNWQHVTVIGPNICSSFYGTGFMSRLQSLIFVGL